MSNKDLFKQAIAEAKTIREAAITNAKEALEESLTPHLKEMLAQKLQEMEEEDINTEEVVNEEDMTDENIYEAEEEEVEAGEEEGEEEGEEGMEETEDEESSSDEDEEETYPESFALDDAEELGEPLVDIEKLSAGMNNPKNNVVSGNIKVGKKHAETPQVGKGADGKLKSHNVKKGVSVLTKKKQEVSGAVNKGKMLFDNK